MSENETVHVSSTGGQKAGNDERYDLIPADPLRLLARHYGVGAKKYDDDNWRKGYDWRLSFAALNRHLWQFWAGEDVDPETGTPHMIAVAWHGFTLAEFAAIHPEFDTRLKTLDERAVRQPADELPPLPKGATWGDFVRLAAEQAAVVQRVVDQLGDDERGAEWTDVDGDRWRWVDTPPDDTGWGIVFASNQVGTGRVKTVRWCGPFTEVVGNA